MTAATTRAYWVEAAGRGALREERLAPPSPEEVALRSEFSGISVGTERLVGRGLVPAANAAMACAGMRGSFALPICYGYSLVGRITDGPRAGRRVFTMHPHQERAVVASERTIELPDAVPSKRATLLPNLETALNATWDAELQQRENVVVVGGGAVGLLLTFVLSTQGRHVVLVEADAERRRLAAALPWLDAVAAPGETSPEAFAVAFHTTGSGDGLQLAIDAVGFEGRVVELSWYGAAAVTLRLGDGFHHRRKRIVASQVGTVAKSHRELGRSVRTAAVLELLHDARLDTLLREPIPFTRLPEVFARIYRGEAIEPCPVVAY